MNYFTFIEKCFMAKSCFIWVNVLCALERMCTLLLLGGLFFRCQLGQLVIVFKSSISFWFSINWFYQLLDYWDLWPSSGMDVYSCHFSITSWSHILKLYSYRYKCSGLLYHLDELTLFSLWLTFFIPDNILCSEIYSVSIVTPTQFWLVLGWYFFSILFLFTSLCLFI